MRKLTVLLGLAFAVAASSGQATAGNPHAQQDLTLTVDACALTAGASWSSTRVAAVHFYFTAPSPVGQFWTPTLTVDPRPARSGALVASTLLGNGTASGRVVAIFVDHRGRLVAELSRDYATTC